MVTPFFKQHRLKDEEREWLDIFMRDRILNWHITDLINLEGIRRGMVTETLSPNEVMDAITTLLPKCNNEFWSSMVLLVLVEQGNEPIIEGV